MSGIMCKCGHEAEFHGRECGCMVRIENLDGTPGEYCKCSTPRIVVECENVVANLTAENATIRAENARLADEVRRLEYYFPEAN